MNEYELYHYGVKGMKWGVRRDARILMNHRYNVEAKRLKTMRDWGMIDDNRYYNEINRAKEKKKKGLAQIEARFKNAKSDIEREKLGRNITNIAVKEVPDIKVQRGLAVANQLLGVGSIGKTAYTAAGLSLINPAFAGAYLGAGAVTAAAQAGLTWAGRQVLDTMS